MQVLTCTEDMMQQRVDFLRQQGLSQEEIGRAVLAHPQVCRAGGLVQAVGLALDCACWLHFGSRVGC